MKPFWRVALAGALVLASLGLAGCGGQEEQGADQQAAQEVQPHKVDTIKKRGYLIAGVVTDMPGFSVRNPETEVHEGYAIDVAEKLGESIFRVPGRVLYEAVTLDSWVEALASEKVDLVVGPLTASGEEQQVEFSPAYYNDGVRLMVAMGSEAAGLQELDGQTIGILAGSSAGEALQAEAGELGISITLNEQPDGQALLTALQEGAVQAAAGAGTDLARLYMEDPENLVVLPEVYSEKQYALATRKGDADLRDHVAEVVADLTEKGTLAKLQQKWGLGGE